MSRTVEGLRFVHPRGPYQLICHRLTNADRDRGLLGEREDVIACSRTPCLHWLHQFPGAWGQWTYLDAHTRRRVVMQEGSPDLGRLTAVRVSRSNPASRGRGEVFPHPSGLLNTL